MILQGDSLEIMRGLGDESVDSLVTDPPAGINFMGKSWDSNKGGRDQWIVWLTEVMRECYRVLKPGAHGLVWALPRTSHWTATALENAGFEVRDVVTHLFGTGFPKSLDVSKAIDKAAGAEREVIGRGKAGKSSIGQETRVLVGARPTIRDGSDFNITAPATDSARQWQGFGTALKPASEHWILIRKPLGEKTVAANVLKHGTGALNIDGCRISTGGEIPLGRFPANLVLSHNDDCDETCSEGCAVAMLDEQSGPSPSNFRLNKGIGLGFSGATGNRGFAGHSDSGGASRFFYCAKSSKADRGANNTHPTVKSTKLMSYLVRLITPPGGLVLDPFMGSGSTGVAAMREGFEFTGIELENDYLAIAEKRIDNAI